MSYKNKCNKVKVFKWLFKQCSHQWFRFQLHKGNYPRIHLIHPSVRKCWSCWCFQAMTDLHSLLARIWIHLLGSLGCMLGIQIMETHFATLLLKEVESLGSTWGHRPSSQIGEGSRGVQIWPVRERSAPQLGSSKRLCAQQGFWGTGHVLLLHPCACYMGVFSWWKFTELFMYNKHIFL